MYYCLTTVMFALILILLLSLLVSTWSLAALTLKTGTSVSLPSRRDEYFQQQSSIMRQHGPSSKAVETFLRGRHQQLDEMFHGQGPPSDPVSCAAAAFMLSTHVETCLENCVVLQSAIIMVQLPRSSSSCLKFHENYLSEKCKAIPEIGSIFSPYPTKSTWSFFSSHLPVHVQMLLEKCTL